MATITRAFEFDAAHRVMNEKVKCFNLHGHRFKVEMTFEYNSKSLLGYAIDFKEIKRIACGYIDEHLDHACLLNPEDTELIELCRKQNWRLWVMGMGVYGDINPSAENIASELFYIIRQLFINEPCGLRLTNLRLYETPNCWVDCSRIDYVATNMFLENLGTWRKQKGSMKYDIREDHESKEKNNA